MRVRPCAFDSPSGPLDATRCCSAPPSGPHQAAQPCARAGQIGAQPKQTPKEPPQSGKSELEVGAQIITYGQIITHGGGVLHHNNNHIRRIQQVGETVCGPTTGARAARGASLLAEPNSPPFPPAPAFPGPVGVVGLTSTCRARYAPCRLPCMLLLLLLLLPH